MKPPSIFVFTVEAVAPGGSPRYRSGHRYDLMVLVHEPRLTDATGICHRGLERAGLSAAKISNVVQLDHKLRQSKLQNLHLGDAVEAAVAHGSATVVMDDDKV